MMMHKLKMKVHDELFKPDFILLSKLFRPVYSGMGSILMFHRVIPDEADILCEDLEIKASYLEKIIHYFIDHDYHIVSLDKAHELITHPKANKQKFVAFTFDDGYLDNYTTAYPIFKKYNIPFTIYVTTSFPDKTALLWWYALKDLVKQNNQIQFSIVEERTYTFPAKTPEEKVTAYNAIRNTIVNTDNTLVPELLLAIFKGSGIELNDYTHQLTLNWDQIKELSEDPLVTIGAHTVNHPNLKKLSIDDLQKEVKKSKFKIENKIDKKVHHFAYPYGTKNEASTREFDTIYDLGFKTATTTRCANVFPKHKYHTTSLPRISPSPYITSPYLPYYANGVIPALTNRLKRTITD